MLSRFIRKGLCTLKVQLTTFSLLVLFALHYFVSETAFKVLSTTTFGDGSYFDAATVPQNYVVPNGSMLVGKDFNFNNETMVVVHNILRSQTFNRTPVTIEPNTPFFDVVVAVTGCSSSHYEEITVHLYHFTKIFPGIILIFYDLGLTKSEANEVKKLPFVAFRKFDFALYPDHVRNLYNYAWKPLIFQQILSEFDGIMWFDSSVKFQEDLTQEIMAQLARYNSGYMFFAKPPGHSILSATHPGMMEYLPLEKAEGVKKMYQGGAVVIINTNEVQKHIMKWLVICMLKKDCVAPSHLKQNSCRYKFPVSRYGGCHRYDQSVMNILVRNTYGPEHKKYLFKFAKRFIAIERLPPRKKKQTP